MKFTKLDKEQWVENCIVCHIAMKPIDSEGALVFGIVESYPTWDLHTERARNNFSAWAANPMLQGTPHYWFCEQCKSIWGVALGAWVKSSWNCTENPITELPATFIAASGVERVIDYTPPFSNASMCPHCHTWRHIINTEVRGVGVDQIIIRSHYCIECKSVQEITSPSPEKQVNDYLKENMTLEGLTGDRNPAKLL